MRVIYPKQVPILEADDMCRGDFTKGERRCLIGWGREVFGTSFDDTNKIHDTLCRAAKELNAQWVGLVHTSLPIVNDSTKNSKSLIARIWNRAMAKLGYVVNNPEAKYLKKK